LSPICPWFAGRPHILRCCSHSWNAANASLNKALRNGDKRRRSPRELALIEACRRLRPLEPICASTEINSSAVSPPFPTIGKGHPQAAQKPRWTAIFVSMPDKPVPVIRDTTAELYHQAGTGPVCLKAGHKPWRLDCLAGHIRFELRNVGANYPFERSRRFPGIKPNSGHRDYSRSSCRQLRSFRGITDDFDCGESFRPRGPGGTARRCTKPCRATSSGLAIPTSSASFIGGVGHHDSDPGLGGDSPQGRTYSKLRCNA